MNGVLKRTVICSSKRGINANGHFLTISPTKREEYKFRDDHLGRSKNEIDNLRITHLQGQVRARYDYYSYGLMWSQPINPYDNTYGMREWQMQEWGDKGIELYQFEARMYDPVLGRWHAPDPLEQFHSPYLANFNNPANFVDPDGRAGKFWQVVGSVTSFVAYNASIFGSMGGAGSQAAGATLNVAGTFAAGFTAILKITSIWKGLENLFSDHHNKQVASAKTTTAGAGDRDGRIMGIDW